MKLHSRAFGDGPPLVILHGLLGSLDNWVPMAQKLAAHFHVLLLDLRNHGRSPHANVFNYDVLAGDLRQFLLKNLGRDEAGQLFWKPNLASLRANYGKVRGALPAATRFDRPTLFLRGENSDYIRDSDLPRILEMFPHAIWRTLCGAGHWVHADAPDEFAKVVSEFLLREM